VCPDISPPPPPLAPRPCSKLCFKLVSCRRVDGLPRLHSGAQAERGAGFDQHRARGEQSDHGLPVALLWFSMRPSGSRAGG
jgi:hypothetical protein